MLYTPGVLEGVPPKNMDGNSNNVFRIGITFEYKDEKCFSKVQKLLSEFMNNTETKELLINTKMSASRGIVLIDKIF